MDIHFEHVDSDIGGHSHGLKVHKQSVDVKDRSSGALRSLDYYLISTAEAFAQSFTDIFHFFLKSSALYSNNQEH